jgi:hypothetical protein
MLLSSGSVACGLSVSIIVSAFLSCFTPCQKFQFWLLPKKKKKKRKEKEKGNGNSWP